MRTGFNPRRIRHCGSFDVQDREQVDSREQIDEREEEDKTRKQPTNAQTCDIMDGMWME